MLNKTAKVGDTGRRISVKRHKLNQTGNNANKPQDSTRRKSALMSSHTHIHIHSHTHWFFQSRMHQTSVEDFTYTNKTGRLDAKTHILGEDADILQHTRRRARACTHTNMHQPQDTLRTWK